MKQKTGFKNFGNIGIGYRSMNGRYIGFFLVFEILNFRRMNPTHTK